jgi:hypothetical protein
MIWPHIPNILTLKTYKYQGMRTQLMADYENLGLFVSVVFRLTYLTELDEYFMSL